jgi:hypothetical protein
MTVWLRFRVGQSDGTDLASLEIRAYASRSTKEAVSGPLNATNVYLGERDRA